MKRTFNLSPDTIAALKRLVEIDHVAATQDALVEHAIAELDRQIQDAHEARLWSESRLDSEFQAELVQIEREFRPLDILAGRDGATETTAFKA